MAFFNEIAKKFRLTSTETLKPKVENQPFQFFGDVATKFNLPTAQSTQAMPPLEPTLFRPPFAKEAKPNTLASTFPLNIAIEMGSRLLELVPKAILQTVQNFREIPAGGKATPLPVSFDPKRLGFDGKIESTGKKLFDEFNQQVKEKQPVTTFDIAKVASMAVFKTVIPDAFDTFVAGDIITSGAKVVLKATSFNPELDYAITKLGLQRQFTFDEFKNRFITTAQDLAAKGDAAGLNELGKATQTVAKGYLKGETAFKLNSFGQQIQNIANELVKPYGEIAAKAVPLTGVGKELPGEALVGEPMPSFGLQIQPVKKVGGVPKGVPEVPAISKSLEPLAIEARKYKSAEEFVKAQQPEKIPVVSVAQKAHYMGGHEAPMGDSGAPIWDLNGKYTDHQIYPADFYTHGDYYKAGETYDSNAISIMQSLKDKPNAPVTVYRAVPKDIKNPKLNAGDWISTTREYAKDHGESNLGENYKIISASVRARDIFTDGNSIHEFGYDPQPAVRPKDMPYDILNRTADKPNTITGSYKSQLTDFYNKATKGVKAEVPPIKRPPSLEKLGLKEKPQMITKPEDLLLRERLRNQARGAKVAVAQYKRTQSFLESITNEITKELNKPLGKQRSVISFVKQLGEFNQTVINEIKNELGIDKPLKSMNLEELKDFTNKLKERLKFKFEKGYTPSVETKEKLYLKDSPKPELNEVDYEKNRQLIKEFKPKIGIIKTIQKAGEGIEKILTPISTRLGNIDPTLKYAMRKFEFEAMNSIQNGKKSVEPYLKSSKKLSKDDFADLDLALKNGDINKITEINKKYGIEKEYAEVKKTLDDIYKRANEVGFDVGYKKDYWPRMIKDTEGFLEYFGKQEYWSVLDKAIKGKEMDLGRYLLPEEKAQLINTMIRGYQGGQITLSGTGAMKERIIDLVTPELNKFYYNSPTSLLKYIEGVNDKIAARKFFGKGNKMEEFNNTEDSIGAYTTDLLAKEKITPKQELELRGILNARFNPRGTHGIVGLYKNLAYMDVMGSFLNAITQLGDQAWSLYRNGLWGTIKADIKGILGKSKITKETLGIEANSIAQEFSDAGKTAKAVDKIFTLTGLNRMDRLGKESLVNGSIEKYQKLAKNPPLDFLKKLDEIFGKESEQVLSDLKSGEITENVKILAFNELLDFHPVAFSEMPEQYLKGANGRIFYMLKSYTLKQFDIFRREAFSEMAKGNWWKGIRNLLSLATLVVLCNGTADEIKDLLTNRKTKLSDRVIDQISMLAGFSRYTARKISEVGLGSALLEQITPPTNFVDNISKDLINMYKDFDKSADINQLKSVQDIPLIGKFYYWWFGKGKETTEKYKEKPSGIGNSTTLKMPSMQMPSLKMPSLQMPSLQIK